MLNKKRNNIARPIGKCTISVLFLLSTYHIFFSCASTPNFSAKDTENKEVDDYSREIEKSPSNHQLYFKRAKVYAKNCGGFSYGTYQTKALTGCIADIEKAIGLAGTNVPSEYHSVQGQCSAALTFGSCHWQNEMTVPRFMESDKAELQMAEAALATAITKAENDSKVIYYRALRLALRFHTKEYARLLEDYEFVHHNVEKFGWGAVNAIKINEQGGNAYEALVAQEKDTKRKAELLKALKRARKTQGAYEYLSKYGSADRNLKKVGDELVLSEVQEDLFEAAAGNDVKGIAKALAEGANINMQDSFYHFQTALHYAIDQKSHNALKALLKAGADPEIGNNSKQTPLARAAGNSDVEAVKILLAGKANPTPRGWSGVVWPKSPEIIRLIKAAGAKEPPKESAQPQASNKAAANHSWCVTVVMEKTDQGLGAARTTYAARIYVIDDKTNANENQIRQFATAANSQKYNNGYRVVEINVQGGDDFAAAKATAQQRFSLSDFMVDHLVKR